ncbi:MAG: hypothetical protein ACPGLV_12915 [Bacteroidia bacterium]
MIELFSKLTSIRESNPDEFMLSISERLSKDDIEKNKLTNPKDNSAYFLVNAYDKDIAIGTSFDVVFARSSPKKHKFINATLAWVNVNPSYKLEYLPKGFGGFGLIQFSKAIPEIFESLNFYSKPRIKNQYDVLYLTSNKMYTSLMNLNK